MNRRIRDCRSFTGRFVVCLCVLAFLACLLPVPAQAEEEPVRVGYYENEVFQEGAEEGAVKTGYAYEYYRKLSEYTGWKYEYVYGGYGELYQMLLDGEIDLLAGLAWRAERVGLIAYPDAIMGSEAYYLVKQEDAADITADPATLNGKRIGVLDSAMVSVLNRYLEDNGVTAEVIAYPDHAQLFSAFDSRQLDVFAAESDGSYARENAEVLCAFGASEYYLCVNIRRPDLLAELNEAQTLLAAEEPNYLNSLSTKYYSVSVNARAFSAAEREWMEGHDALNVGYLENYLPYSDTDSRGEVTGMVKDLIPEILKALSIPDISVSYRGYKNYDDMLADVTAGRIDVAFPVGGGLYYSEESGIYQSNAVTSSSTQLVFKGAYSEDKVARFAVNENNRMQYYYVKTNFPEAEIVFYPSTDDCLAAVLSGAVGCTTLDGLRANDILKNSEYRGLSDRQTSRNDDRCFGVEIGNEGLLKLLNRGVNVLGGDYAQQLSYRYAGGLYTYSFADVIRDHVLLVGSLIVAVAALVIFLLVRDIRRTRKEAREKEAAQLALEEENRVKRREMEQRIALQEQLIRQQKQHEQQNRMIVALSSDYRSVYYVNLDEDEAVCYLEDRSFPDDPSVGEHFPYLQVFTRFGHDHVAESYREGYFRFIQPDNIRAELLKQPLIAYRFLETRDGKEAYTVLRMAGVRHMEDRTDHRVHAIGVGFADIDEEMRQSMSQQQALSEALAAAEQANQAKTAFLSSMSHEIRTPMNAIIGLDSLALRNGELLPETREYLEKIGESARHLLGLINDILDMSRIESGRMILRKEEFSFRAMLEQINTMVMSQCSEKGLQYECSVIGGVSDHYIGDDMKLKQVLINILSNAIKFTEAPGSVKLTVERTATFEDQATLKFSIRDTGIGIDKAFLPKVFDSFTQEDSNRNNKYGSTGLGLAITKNIVTLMNGSISVESEKGVGTEFTVVLTLKNCDYHGPAGSYVSPKDIRVLIVDDEEIAAEHARVILDEIGITADTAGSGPEALNMMEIAHTKHTPYNLVLLDWKMPGMDGLEVARQIRSRFDRKSIIIFLTSFNWDDIMDEALHAGVDSFLAKPLFASNVIDEFERIARKNNMSLYREKRRAELKGRKILLAEDVRVNAMIMKKLIEVKGAEIDHAENGRIVLDMFAKSAPGQYDAILMDIRMPEMDGLEAAAAIRALDRPDARIIPIVALTANAFDEDVQRSLQAGMNAHLSKPVEPEHLYQTLEELIWEAEQAGKEKP